MTNDMMKIDNNKEQMTNRTDQTDLTDDVQISGTLHYNEHTTMK